MPVSNCAFAAYRQLFDHREHKRRTALTPQVDAADPLGSLIGSFTVRGPDVHRLRDHLEDHIGSPRDVAEDAPEFAVRVPIQDVDRPAFATAATRLLAEKNLRPTRDAVTALHALAGSPHDVATALNQLSPEDHPRDVRPDELRYALATLPPDRVVPDLPPTVGKIVAALLAAEGPQPVESGEVTRNSADHYFEVEQGDTIRIEATEEERGGGGGSVIMLHNPDGTSILDESFDDDITSTHQAEQSGEFRAIIATGGTVSYEIFVESD